MNAIERQTITRLIENLTASGYRLNINNGGATHVLPSYTSSRATILEALGQCGEETLWIMRGAEYVGGIVLTYGKNEWVISDYPMSLAAIIEPAIDYAQDLAAGLEVLWL